MATKKVYLVDTENVGSTWKDLLPTKAGTDQILLFFTENSPYVSYLDLQLILQFPDRFEMIKCNPGKNGLDFQLVSYLGYLMKTASKTNYVIVSNDGGFDAVVKFWQDRGMSISRMNVHRALQADAGQAARNTASPAKQETQNGKGSPAKKVTPWQKNKTADKASKGADTGKGSGTSDGNVMAGDSDAVKSSMDSDRQTGSTVDGRNGKVDSSTDSDRQSGNTVDGRNGKVDSSTDFNSKTGSTVDGRNGRVDSSTDSDRQSGNTADGMDGRVDSSTDFDSSAGNIADGRDGEIDYSTDHNSQTGNTADGFTGNMNSSTDSNSQADNTADGTDGTDGRMDSSTASNTDTGSISAKISGGTASSTDSSAASKILTTGFPVNAASKNFTSGIENTETGISGNATDPEPAENPAAETAAITDEAYSETVSAVDSGTAKKSTARKRATTTKNPTRTRARKSTGNAATAQEIPPDSAAATGGTKIDETDISVSDEMSEETAAGNPDVSATKDTEHPDEPTKSMEPDTLPETAPKGKSKKTTRVSTKKTATAAEDAPAAAKRQKKTAAAPLAQPATPTSTDPENIELDFSNLTVSEKAALLRKYLPKEFSENPESLDIISDIMFGHDTTNHHQLHLAFVKNFGDEKGTLIYKAFRPHLAEFRA